MTSARPGTPRWRTPRTQLPGRGCVLGSSSPTPRAEKPRESPPSHPPRARLSARRRPVENQNRVFAGSRRGWPTPEFRPGRELCFPPRGKALPGRAGKAPACGRCPSGRALRHPVWAPSRRGEGAAAEGDPGSLTRCSGARRWNPSRSSGRETRTNQLRGCGGTPSTINIPSAKHQEPHKILLPFLLSRAWNFPDSLFSLSSPPWGPWKQTFLKRR